MRGHHPLVGGCLFGVFHETRGPYNPSFLEHCQGYCLADPSPDRGGALASFPLPSFCQGGRSALEVFDATHVNGGLCGGGRRRTPRHRIVGRFDSFVVTAHPFVEWLGHAPGSFAGLRFSLGADESDHYSFGSRPPKCILGHLCVPGHAS